MNKNTAATKAKKQYSIRRYLTLNLIALALVMTVLPGVFVYFDAAHEVEEIFDANLAQSTRVLHGIINRESIQYKQAILDSLHLKDGSEDEDDDAHEYERKLAFQIWDGDELVIKSPFAPSSPLSKLSSGFSSIDVEGDQWRAFTLYSVHDKWWLILAERTDIRGELTNDISNSHILPIIIFIPILALFVWFVTKKGLAPLHRIATKVKQRSYRNLKTVEDPESPLEVNDLLLEINHLFTHLNEAHERERRFVGDAAHELRTPLASLLIHTENAIDESEGGELEESLISMKHGIARLSHLVGQLLSLSRTEGNFSQGQYSEVSASELCQNTYNMLLDKALSKQQKLSVNINDDKCLLQGNTALLSSLLRNVLDNAIRYTPEKGQVELSCSRENNKVIIYVADSGPGIPAELRERVRDRFYRVTGSGQQGSGLGLSIVDKITDIHGAKWQLLDSRLGGLCVRFEFDISV